MGANKNSNFRKCGNILIDVKTIKSQVKSYAINCGFCNAEYDKIEIFSQHLEEKHLHDFEIELDQTAEPENSSLLTVEQETVKIEEQTDVDAIRREKLGSPFTLRETCQNPLESEPSREAGNTEEIDMPPIKRERRDIFDEDEEYWDPQYNKRFHINPMTYSDEDMDTFQKSNDYTNEKEYPLDDETSGNSKNVDEEFNLLRPLVSSKDSPIYELLLQGKSCREISLILNVSKTKVGTVRKSLPNLPPPSRGGRKKMLSETTERKIFKYFWQQKVGNAVQIQKQLAKIENIHVSVETVRNTLRSAGLKGRANVKKPFLTKMQQKIRLDFAKKYASWTTEDWAKVMWSNETKINLFGSDGRERCWQKPERKFDDESVMVWGCMMSKGVGAIHRILGTMTAQSYVDMLVTNLPSSAEKFGLQTEDLVFQHETGPKHSAKLTQKWLNDNGYNVLDWPPQSADLNPIEHLWNILKKDVVHTSRNLDELWTNVQSAWNSIDPSVCKNLVDSMPHRLEAVITAKGGYTKL